MGHPASVDPPSADARLIDFLMEDISAYGRRTVGAGGAHADDQSRDTLKRYVDLVPVIDGVEGTFTSRAGLRWRDPALVKSWQRAGGLPSGGLLRHKGWAAKKVDLQSRSMAPLSSPRRDRDWSERNRANPQFAIGIDLGRTNSALAFVPPRRHRGPHQLPGGEPVSDPQ